jgi:phosphoglycolate phosphatase-like HAD superfamily hydrolase
MIRAIIFDFDGVLVESTDVKTKAFERLFAGEDPKSARRIVDYHLKNAGVSRFVKFKSIYRDILKRSLSETEFHKLCREFSGLVMDEVVSCPWVAGALEFLERNRGAYSFFIVSGTPEEELQRIVQRRGIAGFFQEVLGSPRTKDILLADIMDRHGLRSEEMIFIGDSETDWEAAQRTEVGFVWRKTRRIRDMSDFSGPSIPSLIYLEQHLTAG